MSSQWGEVSSFDAAPINDLKANVAGERHNKFDYGIKKFIAGLFRLQPNKLFLFLCSLLLEDSLSELHISIEELMKRVEQADDESMLIIGLSMISKTEFFMEHFCVETCTVISLIHPSIKSGIKCKCSSFT